MRNNNDDFDAYFSELYVRNFDRIVKFLITIVHDFPLAEDLTHDVFMKFYRRRIFIPGDPGKTRNYMLKSAKNIAIDYLRREKRHDDKCRRIIEDIDTLDDAFYSEIENAVIEGEIISKVEDTLLEFPERKRKAFLQIINSGNGDHADTRDGDKMSRYRKQKLYIEIITTLQNRLREYMD